MGLDRIKRAIREREFEFTLHALEEMDDDELTFADFEHAVLNATAISELTDDPRGVRFVVRGEASTGDREIEVVCRFLPSGLLRIITMYQVGVNHA